MDWHGRERGWTCTRLGVSKGEREARGKGKRQSAPQCPLGTSADLLLRPTCWFALEHVSLGPGSPPLLLGVPAFGSACCDTGWLVAGAALARRSFGHRLFATSVLCSTQHSPWGPSRLSLGFHALLKAHRLAGLFFVTLEHNFVPVTEVGSHLGLKPGGGVTPAPL